MLGHRVLTAQDYIAILKRRWFVIAIPMVVFSVVAVVITLFVEPQYVSQTLVLIEQQKVPDNYVKPVISEDLNARLASMQEQILSRSRLQPIIERFNLYGTKKLGMDARIEKVRKDITIKPIQSEVDRANGLPGFFISFKAGSASVAQSVCGEITSLFLTENLRSREQSVEGTTDFLKGQLEDAKRNLDQQDAKLADFQRAYMGKLPGDEGTSINMLMTLNTQLDATTQALSRMQQDKSYEETILAQQTREAGSPQQRLQPQTQQAELQQLLSQEAELTARYTSDYPDVVAVRRKIKDLQQEMAKAPAPQPVAVPTTPVGPEPASIQQLRAQLRALDLAIEEKKHEQSRIQSQVATYQERIQASPMVQEQYKDLTRDYQTAQAFYDDLLQKMNQSKMATDLERRQQGEQFKVMDAPNLPDAPTFPNRLMFFAGGLAFGAAIGLAITALLEYQNTFLRSERDIWAFTKLSTLGVIALAGEAEKKEAKPRFRFGRHKQTMIGKDNPLAPTGA
jgi:polysaccharide chain length determinant protein (PEP-CTERM system associated)